MADNTYTLHKYVVNQPYGHVSITASLFQSFFFI